jgi:peroxiredoxin
LLHEAFKGRGLEIVGVGLREDPDTVEKFAAEFGIRFPLWIDPRGQSPAAFGVLAHPNTVLIDRSGRVVGRVPGERDWNSPEAHRLVEWLLAPDRRR